MFTIPGARTPEELETLLEDALITGDRETLMELFEKVAVMVREDDARSARGPEQLSRLALDTWEGDHIYVADPRRVIQARDIALIVTDQVINVARRDRDGAWRYAILLHVIDSGSERNKP